MSRDVMKLALEALEQIARLTGPRWALENSYASHLQAITALREALAEQPAPMSQPNRVVAYSAASKLRELGYEWVDDAWRHLDELAEQPARPYRQLQDNGSKYFGESWDKAEQPAQQEPKIDIYRSFEQWKSGNVLEHGVPRTEHYSEAQLDLVEMGWNYGYDAGRAVEQALDKKAENAREQPAQKCSYPYCGCNSKAWCKVERNEALDKKAENARELGLDYEPARDSGIVTAGGADPRTQRTWVGLTDEERTRVRNTVGYNQLVTAGEYAEHVQKATEAKLKEKNT